MEELTPDEIRLVLSQSRVGHLGLADAGRSYVVPVFFGYDGRHVYFHSQSGLKDSFIAATKEACFAVTRVQSEDAWESVLLFGTVEKVATTDGQLAAMDALISVPLPPEFGVSRFGEPRRTGKNMVIWSFTPTRATGRKSQRPSPSADVA